MKSVTFTRPAKGNGKVTVKLAGHKVGLFTVTGKVRVKHSGTTEIRSGMTAKLTKPGARKLDKALHKNVLTAGQALGSFTIKVSNTPIAGPAAGTGATPNGTLDLNGLPATLSSEGASSLDTLLGTTAFHHR